LKQVEGSLKSFYFLN